MQTGLIDFRCEVRAYATEQPRSRRVECEEVFMVLGTSASSSLRPTTRMPPRRWSGDETNFRRCLYKSDLVTDAGTVSVADARLGPNFLRRTRARERAYAGPLVFEAVRSLNGPLKPSLKRGSIFIRRFLMKHFKCMKLAVVRPPRTRSFLHSRAQSPSLPPFLPVALSPVRLALKAL